jgi:carbon monoxide dehydrogenase subunit G
MGPTREHRVRDDRGDARRRRTVEPIVSTIEITRRAEEVFAYVIDPARLSEWQESVVSSRTEGAGPPGVGTRASVTRRIGPVERAMTAELAELSPPRSWAVHGLDGPVRGNVKGTIEPLDDGARSRVTIELELVGYGIGKLLVPLVVRSQARKEMPRNLRNLKERLESGA